MFLCQFTIIGVGTAQSVGGVASGISDYCSTNNSGFVSLTGHSGDTIRWQVSYDSTITWKDTAGTNATIGFLNLLDSTCYRAIVTKVGFQPDTSTTHCIHVHPVSVAGTITGGGTFCVGNGTLYLSGNTGSVIDWISTPAATSNWSSLSNTTDSVIFSGLTQSEIYRAIVQTHPVCQPDTSAADSVVISKSYAGIISGDTVYCDVSDMDSLHMSGNIGIVTNWLSSEDQGLNWNVVTNTSQTLVYNNLKKTVWYKVVTQLGTCSSDTSNHAIVAIDSSIAGEIINNDTIIDFNTYGEELVLQNKLGQITEWQRFNIESESWEIVANSDLYYRYPPLKRSTKFRVIVQESFCLPDTSNIVMIDVKPKAIGTVLSVFTPNGDGINDLWIIKGIDNFELNEVFVYDVNGMLVLNKTSYKNNWDGTFNGAKLPDGTYYYVIHIKEKGITLKGAVDILRAP